MPTLTLDEIFEEWDKDVVINKDELADAAQVIPKLHAKYLRMYSAEKMFYQASLFQMKRLKLLKHEFYTQGPSKETQSLGWALPSRGMILKNDVPMYLDADKEMSDLQAKLDLSQIKIDALEMILKQVNSRSYIIRDMIEWKRFTGGN